MGLRTQILIIEDDSDDEEMMMHVLRKAHLAGRVKVIPDGHDAADYLGDKKNEAEDLMAVFLDLNLPSLDGIDLLKMIRKNDRLKNLPVIVMTSSEDADELEECRNFGVHSYLQKPVSFPAFASALANTFHLVSDPTAPSNRSSLGS